MRSRGKPRNYCKVFASISNSFNDGRPIICCRIFRKHWHKNLIRPNPRDFLVCFGFFSIEPWQKHVFLKLGGWAEKNMLRFQGYLPLKAFLRRATQRQGFEFLTKRWGNLEWQFQTGTYFNFKQTFHQEEKPLWRNLITLHQWSSSFGTAIQELHQKIKATLTGNVNIWDCFHSSVLQVWTQRIT